MIERTLADYAQHDNDCKARRGHLYGVGQCSCGLDALLRPRVREHEKDHELAVQLIIRYARGGNEHQLEKARALLGLPWEWEPNHHCQFCAVRAHEAQQTDHDRSRSDS